MTLLPTEGFGWKRADPCADKLLESPELIELEALRANIIGADVKYAQPWFFIVRALG